LVVGAMAIKNILRCAICLVLPLASTGCDAMMRDGTQSVVLQVITNVSPSHMPRTFAMKVKYNHDHVTGVARGVTSFLRL
jgi:hypothetical protein